jgi:hypothetical protein
MLRCAIPLIWLGSGCRLVYWLAQHRGASGLLYGLLAFFRQRRVAAGPAFRFCFLLICFLYGTMIWVFFRYARTCPGNCTCAVRVWVSLLAWIYRHGDQMPVKRYAWEYDDSVPEWYLESTGEEFELPEKRAKLPGKSAN